MGVVEEQILARMPYGPSFLFVDRFLSVDDSGAEGCFRFPKEASYYEGHFPERPVTPGVLLIETMAQIGLVGLGIYLTGAHLDPKPLPFAFTESNIAFLKPVFPGQQVRVRSRKEYFRLGKLKCSVEMWLEEGDERAARGTLSGMILGPEHT